MGDTYRCAACGEEYEKGWTDEEAAAEAETLFTAEERQDMAVVCDDCWRKMGFDQ